MFGPQLLLKWLGVFVFCEALKVKQVGTFFKKSLQNVCEFEFCRYICAVKHFYFTLLSHKQF